MKKDEAKETSTTAEMTAFESRLLNLLALQLVQERPQLAQIDLLNRAGFRPKEIAALLRTTDKAVNARLSDLRKAAKKQ